MPEHIGHITLKGEAAKKLMKSVGNTMSATISGKVESASIDEDFDVPREVGSKKDRPKVARVSIDITGIKNISNPSHLPGLKEIVG